MKKSLRHLPKQKREELNRIVSVIRALCDDVEMIILFGSYARGDWKEEADLKPERKSGHRSDYDILVVVKDKATADRMGFWHDITTQCNRSDLSTHVRIIAHDIQHVNIRLAEGQYFFKDIKKEGCLLYDSANFGLARKRKLKPAEKRRIAQDYYDYWFQSAQGFVVDSGNAFNREDYRKAVFYLHQGAEACYKTILLVFTGYIPNEHYLGLLGEMAARHDAALRDIFPRETWEEDELLRLFDYAYIGARYDPEFRISRDQVEYLSGRVKLLLELTEKRCKAKIESLTANRYTRRHTDEAAK